MLNVGLASKELVAPYLTGSSLAESVEQLGRLHQAVELSAACQTFLPLPPASLKAVSEIIFWDQCLQLILYPAYFFL